MLRFQLDQLALFPAAIAAGLGLGLVGLAVLAPVSPVSELAAATAAGPAATPLTIPRTDWPQLFGAEVAQEPPPEPALEPIEEDLLEDDLEDTFIEYDIDALILRGILSNVDGGGTAIIETPDGQVTVASGDFLPDGATVGEFSESGVEIEMNGVYYLLEFPPAAERRSPAAPVSGSYSPRQRSLDEASFPSYTDDNYDMDDMDDNYDMDEPERPRRNFGLSR